MKKLIMGLALAVGVACALAPAIQPVYANGGGHAGSSYRSYVSKQMTLHLVSGDEETGLYEGTVNADGLPDGHGRLTGYYPGSNERWQYEGEFRNGHYDYGKITDIDNTKAWREGVFIDDELTGYGKLGKSTGKIFEVYFSMGIPLAQERSLSYPVRYSDWEFYINDIYEDDYFGSERANGRFIILRMTAKNLSDLYVNSIARPGIVRLWDSKSGHNFKVATEVMKRYYSKYNDTGWIENYMNPNSTTSNVALVFDVPYYVDNRDLKLLFYVGGESIGQVYTIDIK
jgi:hypothetical protein